MPPKARYLRDALKRDVYPFLEERGFKKLKGRGAICIDFNRPRGERVDCLTIQFDKYGWARFKVRLAQCSPERVSEYFSRQMLSSDIGTCECLGEKSILCSKPNPSGFVKTGMFGLGWFSLKWGWLIGRERAATRTAQRLISLFPQCEEWWENKKYGPHLFRGIG